MSEPVGDRGRVPESKLVSIANIKGPANEIVAGQVREGPLRIELEGKSPKQKLNLWAPSMGPVDEGKIGDYIAAPHGVVGGSTREAVQGMKVFPFPGKLLPLGEAFQAQGSKLLSIVVLGSSTANQGNASAGLGWVDRLAARIGPRPLVRLEGNPAVPTSGAQVYQGAQGGSTSYNYLTDDRLAALGRIKPALVLHMVGSNDFAEGRAPADYKASMKAAIEKAVKASPDSVQVLIHQQGRNDITSPKFPWADYGRALSELAEELGQKTAYLNVDQVFRRMDGLPGLDWMGLLAADMTHLTNPGHRILAEIIGDWLGFPAPMSLGTEVFERGPLYQGDNGTFYNSRDPHIYARVEIPARPYPRKLIGQASVFARHVSGGAAEMHIGCPGAWTPGLRHALINLGTGINQPLVGHFGVPAHWSGEVQIRVVVPPGSASYLTPNEAYTAFTVQAIPE